MSRCGFLSEKLKAGAGVYDSNIYVNYYQIRFFLVLAPIISDHIYTVQIQCFAQLILQHGRDYNVLNLWRKSMKLSTYHNSMYVR